MCIYIYSEISHYIPFVTIYVKCRMPAQQLGSCKSSSVVFLLSLLKMQITKSKIFIRYIKVQVIMQH